MMSPVSNDTLDDAVGLLQENVLRNSVVNQRSSKNIYLFIYLFIIFRTSLL